MSHARGFPAFPPVGGTGRFARTWWGRAWIAGLEDSALDNDQLRVGRRLARSGQVGAITVSAGRLAAHVHDHADDTGYATVLRVPVLSDAEWDRVAGQVAAESGHIAALLDGEMPAALADAAAAAGVGLLPGIGDFDSECGCPGWEMPCRHAAAVAYQAAWLLDADPFVLLLIRGRGREFLLEPPPAPAGRPAAEVFAARPTPLPDPPEVPDGPPAPLSVPPAPGIDPGALALLAADAAVRAAAMLTGPVPELGVAEDVVRFAAAHPSAVDRLRSARADIERAVAAWRQGGRVGLRVLEASWRPPAAEVARGRAAVAEVVEVEIEAAANRLTAGRVQVRMGRDGRWYPYRERDGRFWPSGRPSADAGTGVVNAGG